MKTLLILVITIASISAAALEKQPSQAEPCSIDIPCSEEHNQVCNLDKGLCECKPGHTFSFDMIQCLRTFGLPCTTSPGEGCNTDRNIACHLDPGSLVNGHCGCSKRKDVDGVTLIYNDKDTQCEAKFNQTCVIFDLFDTPLHCTPNAYCQVAPVKVCACNTGYRPDEQLRCVRVNGQLNDPCEHDSECDFETLRLTCEGEGDEPETCQCKRGHELNSNGVCVGKLGTACSSVSPCQDGLVCSSDTGVIGVCQQGN